MLCYHPLQDDRSIYHTNNKKTNTIEWKKYIIDTYTYQRHNKATDALFASSNLINIVPLIDQNMYYKEEEYKSIIG